MKLMDLNPLDTSSSNTQANKGTGGKPQKRMAKARSTKFFKEARKHPIRMGQIAGLLKAGSAHVAWEVESIDLLIQQQLGLGSSQTADLITAFKSSTALSAKLGINSKIDVYAISTNGHVHLSRIENNSDRVNVLTHLVAENPGKLLTEVMVKDYVSQFRVAKANNLGLEDWANGEIKAVITLTGHEIKS